MEAEKSHALLPTSWRFRKADDVIHSQSESLIETKTRRADGVNPSPRARKEVKRPSSIKWSREEKEQIS